MARTTAAFPDVPEYFPQLVGAVLRGGVVLSAILFALGVFLAYTGGAAIMAPARLTGSQFASELRSGGPTALILGGLIVLVLTPLLRVVISFLMFLRVGDRAFSAITAIVLAVLAGTIVIGVLA
ncbi:MAG: DUF1634 domain-containing protein [Thermoplasmata archaeon]|nr:DUF1634 domain-containing protein [Thermoplasmata archaeon]